MSKTRVYIVEAKADGAERLIRSANALQARSHVAKDSYETRVASQDDLIRLVAAGVKVEVAASADPE